MSILRRGPLEEMVTALVGSGVVCPQPAVWNRLWSRIKTQVNDAEPVPMPLILAVWHSASDQRKTERFIDQLVIARRYGLEADLFDVIGAMTDADWHRSSRPEPGTQAAASVRGMEATAIERGLVAAYLDTEFVVSGSAEIVFKIGERSAALDALIRWHGCECAAFITAFNPFSEACSPSQNAQAQALLLQQIAGWGLDWFEGEGRDPGGEWPGEPSVLVLGISEAHASEVGRTFGQNALVWCRVQHPPELLLLR